MDHAIGGALIQLTRPLASADLERVSSIAAPVAFADVVASISQALFAVDDRLDVIWANPPFFDCLAATVASVLHKSVGHLPFSDRAGLREALGQALRTGRPFTSRQSAASGADSPSLVLRGSRISDPLLGSLVLVAVQAATS